MPDPVDTVNAVVHLFDRWSKSASDKGDVKNSNYYGNGAAAMRALLAELQELRRWRIPVPASYGDISDLPDELVRQLAGVKTDELEDQVYAIVKAAGDQIELDRLLIELFRRHGHVFERRFLNNKCYRMTQKGLIHQVPGRKGVYTVHVSQSSEADAPKKPTAAVIRAMELDSLPDSAGSETDSDNEEEDDEIPF